ncbi:FhaA domain-containing protein [Streptomyces beijiangensis]|uniref:DUF3662 domain-containing protein n=1 Tax=Streptomyces beijiangensis TaxID=163361 RepID=A0A939FB27_9ACTN|nr:FhaA domain-containing protein [Streptomyces beijiangensis]MBO0514991.1 DUF3662 domain-containing protein [Streptomyces beijiangensis]
MRYLTALECAMERYSDALWALLVPPTRNRAEVVGILRRECDNRALILDRQRTLVPNTFVIELPADAHRQLAASSAQVTQHLAAQVRRHAAEQGYTFAGPIAVHLAPVHSADIDRFRIGSRITPA